MQIEVYFLTEGQIRSKWPHFVEVDTCFWECCGRVVQKLQFSSGVCWEHVCRPVFLPCWRTLVKHMSSASCVCCSSSALSSFNASLSVVFLLLRLVCIVTYVVMEICVVLWWCFYWPLLFLLNKPRCFDLRNYGNNEDGCM